MYSRPFQIWTCFLVFATFALSRAPAAPPPAEISSISVGYSGYLVPERWCPIAVTILGGPDPFSGLLTINYKQDATQNAQIILPVATTPGVMITVHALVAIPTSADTIAVSLTHGSLLTGPGREIAKADIGRRFGENRQETVPLILAALDPIALGAVGDAAGPGSGLGLALHERLDPNQAPQTNSTARPGAHAFVARFTLDNLPASPMAYDGLTALVLRADDFSRIDQRARSAIRQWLICGGRLVLLADRPGPDYRRWLPPPPGPEGDLFTLDEPAPTPLPAEPASILAVQQVEHVPAPMSRLIRLTPAAIASGWKAEWQPGSSAATDTGLLAQGPVGLGWCIVLGLDPRRVPSTLSDDAAAALWNAALSRSIADSNSTKGANQEFTYSSQGSGESPRAIDAISRAVETLSNVPPIGHSVFVLIAVAMLLMAVLLGPGDYLVLGRLEIRHRSYLSAPIWIAIAAAAAYYGPVLLRPGQPAVNRLEVVDILAPSADAAAEPLAVRSGITAAFANATAPAKWQGLPEGDFLRGVSSLTNHFGDTSRTTPTLVCALRPAALGELADHWGGTPGGAAGQCAPVEGANSLGLWTLRVFADQGRIRSSITATPSPPTADRRAIRVSGLPAGATITAAVARHGGQWAQVVTTFDPPSSPTSMGDLTATLDAAIPALGSEWTAPVVQSVSQFTYRSDYDRRYTPPASPGSVMQLPGAPRRALALDARSDTPGWATLYLWATAPSSGATLSPIPQAPGTHTFLLRICVPVTWPTAP